MVSRIVCVWDVTFGVGSCSVSGESGEPTVQLPGGFVAYWEYVEGMGECAHVK